MTKEEQEKRIIEEMRAYFDENSFNPDDENMVAKLEQWIYDLVSLEAEAIGYTCETTEIRDIREIKHYNDRKIRIVFLKNKSDYHCSASMCNKIDKSDYYIVFVEGYWEDFNDIPKNILNAIIHEMRHVIQDLLLRTGVSAASNLTMAKEMALLLLDDDDLFKKIYDENHDAFLSEEDATVTSSEIIGHIYGSKQFEYNGASYIRKGNEYIQREEYIAEVFEELIIKDEQKRQKAFKAYPILLKEYNKDGTRKSSKQLIRQMQDEADRLNSIKDLDEQDKKNLTANSEGMYFELLYRRMPKTNIKELEEWAAMYRGGTKRNLFDDMRAYFHEKGNKEGEIAQKHIINGEAEKKRRLDYYSEKESRLQKVKNEYTEMDRIIALSKLYVTTRKLRKIKNWVQRIIHKREYEGESR